MTAKEILEAVEGHGKYHTSAYDGPVMTAEDGLKALEDLLIKELEGRSVDVERWVGGNQATGHAESFKALPLSILKETIGALCSSAEEK